MNAMPCRITDQAQLPEDVYHAYKDDEGTPESAQADLAYGVFEDFTRDVDCVIEAVSGEGISMGRPDIGQTEHKEYFLEIGRLALESQKLSEYGTQYKSQMDEIDRKAGQLMITQARNYLMSKANESTGGLK